jgi:hypothetical protein
MSELFRQSQRIVVLGLAAAGVQEAWAEDLPEVVATKDPSCGCCEAWVKHLRDEGFRVQVVNAPVSPVKVRLGVPRELASCHTAQVGGYVVEGHVPASAIKRLLAEKPTATGLAVPGMPVGSPGMEVDGMEPATYEVVLFGPGGRSTFARFRGQQTI